MTPKKIPRPKPRKNPNRKSSIVNRKSKKSCLHCRYWSMWDGSCAARAMALDDFSPIDPDTPRMQRIPTRMKTYKRKRGKDKVYRRYYGGNAEDDLFHYAVCYKERCGGMLLLTRVTATSQLSCPRNMYSYNASIKIRKH